MVQCVAQEVWAWATKLSFIITVLHHLSFGDVQTNWHDTKEVAWEDATLSHSFRQGYKEPGHRPCTARLHRLAPGAKGGCPRVCWEGGRSSENYTSQDASWPRLSQPSKGRPRRELPNSGSPVHIVGSQGGPGGNWSRSRAAGDIRLSSNAPSGPHVPWPALRDAGVPERKAFALVGPQGGGETGGHRPPRRVGPGPGQSEQTGLGRAGLHPAGQRRCSE